MTKEICAGDRVQLVRAVDRWPDFIADKGMTGVVSSIDDRAAWVKIDQPIKGAEEWENEIQWEGVCREEFDLEIVRIGDAS